MLNIDVNLAKVNADIDKFAKAAEKGVRPGAQAGAQLFYEAARREAPVSKAPHMFHIEGRVYGPYKPGTLRDSIYQAYSKSSSGKDKATYHVSWNKDEAPYGFMIVRGTSRTPADDFIGRAYDKTVNAAKQAAIVRFHQEFQKAL